MKKFFRILLISLALLVLIYLIFFRRTYPPHIVLNSWSVGDSLDSHKGVVVYNNGPDYPKTHGKHYNSDKSYYYGKKWQCVEYIKRYYYDALKHKMPDGFGHAKDFFDADVKHGKLNKRRGLLQFVNGASEKPKPDDILVFGGQYGHVAVVINVSDDEVEVIQQNIFMRPREKFLLLVKDGNYTVGDKKVPMGWLRVPGEVRSSAGRK